MSGFPAAKAHASHVARLAVMLAVPLMAGCAAQSDFATLAGGGAFNPQDCSVSPIAGLSFQECKASPWMMGAGHASSGGFSVRQAGTRPGSEGGIIDSEKIYAASFSDGNATVAVQYAVPRSSFGAFYETTPLNGASRVGVMCDAIQEQPCKAGSPIGDLRVRNVEINGRQVRLEEFSVLDNPAFHSGFVAYIPGEPDAARPGYRTSAVVRGFLAQPDPSDGRVASYLKSLRFQRFDVAS
jgi:hypothetical protein